MAHDVTPADMGVVERVERELGAARAEIARLARLLDLRGRDTAPASEQLAVPAPALVTNASPNPDKLALYADRFRARMDVYARRYENRWTGKSGWTPAVVGGWRKGMKHESASYLPLTPEVIKEHFWGNVFIGFYPLLADNTCYFFVADFDGKPAMLDALAYAKAARTNGGLPADPCRRAQPRPGDRRDLHRSAQAGAGDRGRRDARPRQWHPRRAAGRGQDRHGQRDDR